VGTPGGSGVERPVSRTTVDHCSLPGLAASVEYFSSPAMSFMDMVELAGSVSGIGSVGGTEMTGDDALVGGGSIGTGAPILRAWSLLSGCDRTGADETMGAGWVVGTDGTTGTGSVRGNDGESSGGW